MVLHPSQTGDSIAAYWNMQYTLYWDVSGTSAIAIHYGPYHTVAIVNSTVPMVEPCCSRRTARTRGAATSRSASTATRGSSTSTWCAPEPSAMSTRAVVPWYHGTTSGHAAEAYAAVKVAKYADQDNLIPFILETGGRVNKAARDWLDALTAPEPGEQVPSQDGHPWNPQARTTTETVLREAMQARRCGACRPTCLRGLWWRFALQTSLSSWNCSIP
jgi:hypothetical protein